MKRTRPLVITLILVVLVCLGAFGFAAQQKPDIPLISGAKAVFALPGNTPYWWIEADNLLILKSPSPTTFVRRSLSSGQEEAIPALNAAFTETHGTPDSLRISPDGKWLLWTAQDRRKTGLFSLSGGRSRYVVAHEEPVRSLWLLDGKQWVAIAARGGILYRGSLFAMSKPDRIDRTSALADSMPDADADSNFPRATITPEGQFLVQAWKGPDVSFEAAHLFGAGFGANPMNTRHLTLPVPHTNEGGELFFAPQHALVGWRLVVPDPFPALFGLSRRPLSRFNTGFWVTKERETKCLGYLPTVRGDACSGPYGVQFTPDGKSISYIYNNTFYLLPVPF